MNEVTVSLEFTAMPSNWITAEDAREIATSLRNTRFTELMDFIMSCRPWDIRFAEKPTRTVDTALGVSAGKIKPLRKGWLFLLILAARPRPRRAEFLLYHILSNLSIGNFNK